MDCMLCGCDQSWCSTRKTEYKERIAELEADADRDVALIRELTAKVRRLEAENVPTEWITHIMANDLTPNCKQWRNLKALLNLRRANREGESDD